MHGDRKQINDCWGLKGQESRKWLYDGYEAFFWADKSVLEQIKVVVAQHCVVLYKMANVMSWISQQKSFNKQRKLA